MKFHKSVLYVPMEALKLRCKEEYEDSDDDQDKTDVHVPSSISVIDFQRGE